MSVGVAIVPMDEPLSYEGCNETAKQIARKQNGAALHSVRQELQSAGIKEKSFADNAG